MEKTRINQYRNLWLLVFFDLPTQTKAERKAYATFRKGLLEDGFTMFQYSVYLRHSPSRENLQVHMRRVKRILPPEGHVCMLSITDKQFGNIELFYGLLPKDRPNTPQQLELF
jgi:CRISPR-associated protein Cas2